VASHKAPKTQSVITGEKEVIINRTIANHLKVTVIVAIKLKKLAITYMYVSIPCRDRFFTT